MCVKQAIEGNIAQTGYYMAVSNCFRKYAIEHDSTQASQDAHQIRQWLLLIGIGSVNTSLCHVYMA